MSSFNKVALFVPLVASAVHAVIVGDIHTLWVWFADTFGEHPFGRDRGRQPQADPGFDLDHHPPLPGRELGLGFCLLGAGLCALVCWLCSVVFVWGGFEGGVCVCVCVCGRACLFSLVVCLHA